MFKPSSPLSPEAAAIRTRRAKRDAVHRAVDTAEQNVRAARDALHKAERERRHAHATLQRAEQAYARAMFILKCYKVEYADA